MLMLPSHESSPLPTCVPLKSGMSSHVIIPQMVCCCQHPWYAGLPLVLNAVTWLLVRKSTVCGQHLPQVQVRFVSDDVEEEGLDEGGVTKE